MFSTLLFLIILRLSLLAHPATAQTSYDQPCPVLGLDYPNPSQYASNSIVQSSMQDLEKSIADLLKTPSVYGQFNSNTTAFAVDVYSLEDESPLFTYHYTPQGWSSRNTEGVGMVDSNTIFRVGSVSKLYTVYLYLIAAGDKTWNEPITKFIPELASYVERNKDSYAQSDIDVVDWSSITVGALAGQMAGLPRDAAYSEQLQQVLSSYGLPPPSTDETAMCGDDTRSKIPCNRTAFFEAYLAQHPVVSPFKTPIYSNAAYQILGYAIENITGASMKDLFQSALVKPLGLNGTFYTVPPSTDNGIVPGNTTISWWNADALDETVAGGYFSSINDMRKVGKAMLNSTLIAPAQTRRWMKPHAFTANVNYSVGAPWEIHRAPSKQVSWIYGKAGNIGAYSAMTALMPEYNVGFSVLAAGSDDVNAIRILSDMTAAITVPALESAAKSNAASIYAGVYADPGTNSTMTLSTSETSPGLVVTDWKFAGVDVPRQLGTILGLNPTTQNLTVYLSYTGLKNNNGTTQSWRAQYQVSPQPTDPGAYSTNCASWEQVNLFTYGGIGLDEFLFTLDANNGSTASSVQPRVFGKALLLNAKGGMRVPKLMRRVKRF